MPINIDHDTESIQVTPQSGTTAADSGLIRLDITAAQLLRLTNASNVATLFSPKTMAIDWQCFTSNDTWNKPSGSFMHLVICVSGGGGGGSGRRGAAASVRLGGASGGSGLVTMLSFATSQLASAETVTVGTGGTGGPAQTVDNTNGSDGTSGTSSFFGGSTVSNSILGAVIGPASINRGGAGNNTAAATGTQNVAWASYIQFWSSSSVTNSGVGPSGTFGPGAGGGGGGINSSNVLVVAGAGGAASGTGAAFRASTNGGGGAVVLANVGSNGADGVTDGTSHNLFGAGGAGGSVAVGAGRAGGNGGFPGGGGGGGSASLNANASGAGGDGGNGAVFVISWVLL